MERIASDLILCFNSLFLLMLFSCSDEQGDKKGDVTSLHSGLWVMEMEVEEGTVLPFIFEVENKDTLSFIVINGSERIPSKLIDQQDDSLVVRLPYYDSEFRMVLVNDSTMRGHWHNFAKAHDYKIPCRGIAGNRQSETTGGTAAGKWQVTFSPGTDDAYPAIGLFEQEGTRVNGTFATETGDYRFLSGKISGDELTLSCFDGSHAFLFKSRVSGDSILDGVFWSGNHYKESWAAVRNDAFELRHADSITTAYSDQELALSFPNTEGEQVALNESVFRDKVSIIQIMGSWCPNCIDETTYYSGLYEKLKHSGLQIYAVAYERSDDFDKAVNSIKTMVNDVGVSYPVLFAGKANKAKSAQDFPVLSGVTSYPTSIFVDKKGKIRKVHTGFYGPGTGSYYSKYTQDTELFIAELLAE